MLPKAEGCCTGLQLSAKEVVLGRPDMVSPALPQRRSPLSSSCLRPPPRPGGPACRSLARSAVGDGWDTPHETPGPPLPPWGSPLPSRSLSPGGCFFSCLLLTPPTPHTTILPGRAAGSESHLPPAPLPSEGVSLGLAAPTPGASHMGRRLAARLLRSRRRVSLLLFPLALYFSFSSFSSFSSFPAPRSSPFSSLLREAAGNGTIFFPRRRDLRALPSGGEAKTSRNRIRWWRRDPRRAEGGEAAGRPRCSLTLLLSAAMRRRWLRRCGSSLRPPGQLAAAQARHAALRTAAGGDGTGHNGGGFPAPPQPGFRELAALADFAAASPGAQGTQDSSARLKSPAGPPSQFLPISPFVLAAPSAACLALAAARCACLKAAQPPVLAAAPRCGAAVSAVCEYPAEEPRAPASPRPEAVTETPEPSRGQS